MTRDGWERLIGTAVQNAIDGDRTQLELLLDHLIEIERTETLLQEHGYKWLGCGLFGSVQMALRHIEVLTSDDKN